MGVIPNSTTESIAPRLGGAGGSQAVISNTGGVGSSIIIGGGGSRGGVGNTDPDYGSPG